MQATLDPKWKRPEKTCICGSDMDIVAYVGFGVFLTWRCNACRYHVWEKIAWPFLEQDADKEDFEKIGILSGKTFVLHKR